jgi:hypothetical protein
MLAPSRAARNAMAWPMPRLAPVMKSVLPARLTCGFLFFGGRFCASYSFALLALAVPTGAAAEDAV